MLILLWLITVLAAASLLGFIALKWLSIRRDYFFLLLMGQALIYLHVSPAFAATQLRGDMQSLYVAMAAMSLVLFEIPAVCFYAKIMKRWAVLGHDRFRLKASGLRTLLIAATGIGYGLWFIATTINYQLLYIRIGPVGVLSAYAELPFFVWVGYRLFADTGGILGAALLIVTLRTPVRMRWAPGLATVVVYTVYGLFVLVNNRLDSILMGAVAFGVVAYWHAGVARRRWAIPAAVVGLMVMAVYSARVVSTIRYNFLAFGEVRAEWFSPFYSDPSNVRVVGRGSPLVMRLNGIDLMARLTPRAFQDGFALGAAWKGTLAPLVLSVIDRERANELKQQFGTDAKVYLMHQYTTLSQPDYFSSALLDAYGNFGPPGLLLVVLVLGGLAAFGTRQILQPVSRHGPFIGLWIFYNLLTFEQPLITTFTNLLRYSPMLVMLLALNPLHFTGDTTEGVPTSPNPEHDGEPESLVADTRSRGVDAIQRREHEED